MSKEPIAIIGMGCRYPGDVRTPDEFWDLLSSGRDVLCNIPNSRWEIDKYYDSEVSLPGKMYVRKGYYLNNVDQFDPQFFGLSPREADSLDPQQRMVMEVSWETLEHAGIPPTSLKGEKTGVFVGQYWDDYSSQRIYTNDIKKIDRYTQLSALRGLTAGRVCHFLDSNGPAIQLDTACSSSSLAIHLACQSLRSGESNLALAGGVSLVLAPEHLIGICQMTALSPDGRCKTFDASANGFGQGEGCGMIALKRLCDAEVDGDNILAIIQGSAVNHDGHARTVTTPSGPAQRAMLKDALANAGLEAHQIDFVETHGTGTPLGDPIEVSAIARVLCEDRRKPLYLGSVKTNVGHLDSAAGVAGLMKVVLSLQNKTIPRHLNFLKPNRHIPWDDWPLKIPTKNTIWKGKERFAGVSSFGMSGTNVHLIIGQAPEPIHVKKAKSFTVLPQHLLTLSAKAPEALTEMVNRFALTLETDRSVDEDRHLSQLCFSAANCRSHFPHRVAFTANNKSELAKTMYEFSAGKANTNLARGEASRHVPKLVFLFTGQGAQYIGMGKSLYAANPFFRMMMDKCSKLLEPHLEKSILNIMWAGEALHQTAYTQPALFTIEYSLTKLFEKWGILPEVLIGHSVGEYVAACIAGVFPLEDALQLVAARGRLMQSLPSGGKMVSVDLDEQSVLKVITDYPLVSVAAVNAPHNVVLSGNGKNIDTLVKRLGMQRIKTTYLKVSHAFHSPMMDPILEKFGSIAKRVSFAPPSKTLISNLTGKPWGKKQVSPEYWVEHLRGTVRFSDGIDFARSKKFRTFVEIGPKPTLISLGRASFAPDFGIWIPSLKQTNECFSLLQSIGQLYVRGAHINWNSFYDQYNSKRVTLPNYPWRYQRCWTDVVLTGRTEQHLHPLVHTKINNASKSIIFESRLSSKSPAYLQDHQICGSIIFPASAFFEISIAVARLIFHQDEVALTNATVGRALTLPDEPITVQMIATRNDEHFDFGIYSLTGEGSDARWVKHATGILEPRLPSTEDSIDINKELQKYTYSVDIKKLSTRFEAFGLQYFSRFNAIEAIFTPAKAQDGQARTALARIRLPNETNLPGDNYRLHPVVVDASFRTAEAMFPEKDTDQVYLPFAITEFGYSRATHGTVWVKVTASQRDRERIVDLNLFDETGEHIASIKQLILRSVPVSSLNQVIAKPLADINVLPEWVYGLTWEDRGLSSLKKGADVGAWLLLADQGGIATNLLPIMEKAGHVVHISRSLNSARTFLGSEKAASLKGIIHLWAMDSNENKSDIRLSDSLLVLQEVTKVDVNGKHWFITKGSQAIDTKDMVSPWQSQFWGFGRTLHIEQPNKFGGCIDLDPSAQSTLDNVGMLVDELLNPSDEREVAYRKGARLVARLSKTDLINDRRALPVLNTNSCYLITGGLGALGLQVARYLASQGASNLVLTGRSGVSNDYQRTILKSLKDKGVTVQIETADIGKAEDVERLLTCITNLRGIVHIAGVLEDGIITHQSPRQFAKVAEPKVHGAWNLHLHTQDMPLEFFILFSSVASIIGSVGQSNYASANAFMDGLAHYRKQQGLVATAINWGPWADIGMASSNVVLQRLLKDGWQPMGASQGCNFIGYLLNANDLTQVAILPLDWEQFAESNPYVRNWTTLSSVLRTGRSNPLIGSAADLAAQSVREALPIQRIDQISSYLLERIAQTIHIPTTDFNESSKLINLGVDSLTAVEIQLWIRRDLDLEFPFEDLFSAPTIRDLAVSIDKALVGSLSLPEKKKNRLKTEAGQWVICSNKNTAAALRLFCFPYAGGSASAFKSWAKALPESIDLCSIQMPGREDRLNEPSETSMQALIETLAKETINYSDCPFAFFGHSMGAIVAYETACQLRNIGAHQPMHLFLSARAAPHIQEQSAQLRFLDDKALVDQLQQTYGAVPEAIRTNSDLRAKFLPTLRADIELLEKYEYLKSEPLDCPITAIGGKDDPAITEEMLQGWRTHTSAQFKQYIFPGKHFYINAEYEKVIKMILNELHFSYRA